MRINWNENKKTCWHFARSYVERKWTTNDNRWQWTERMKWMCERLEREKEIADTTKKCVRKKSKTFDNILNFLCNNTM